MTTTDFEELQRLQWECYVVVTQCNAIWPLSIMHWYLHQISLSLSYNDFMRTHDRTNMVSLFWAQLVKSNCGSRPCCKRTDRYKESHRRWNLHVTVAKRIVTAEKKKRYSFASDVALNCAKFVFVRNENRRWKWTSYRRLQRENVPNTTVNSGDNASSRTSLALLQFSKRNRIDVCAYLQPTTDHRTKNKKR